MKLGFTFFTNGEVRHVTITISEPMSSSEGKRLVLDQAQMRELLDALDQAVTTSQELNRQIVALNAIVAKARQIY